MGNKGIEDKERLRGEICQKLFIFRYFCTFRSSLLDYSINATSPLFPTLFSFLAVERKGGRAKKYRSSLAFPHFTYLCVLVSLQLVGDIAREGVDQLHLLAVRAHQNLLAVRRELHACKQAYF